MQVRDRSCCPPPQLTVHVPQMSQAANLPFTKGKDADVRIFLKRRKAQLRGLFVTLWFTLLCLEGVSLQYPRLLQEPVVVIESNHVKPTSP